MSEYTHEMPLKFFSSASLMIGLDVVSLLPAERPQLL